MGTVTQQPALLHVGSVTHRANYVTIPMETVLIRFELLITMLYHLTIVIYQTLQLSLSFLLNLKTLYVVFYFKNEFLTLLDIPLLTNNPISFFYHKTPCVCHGINPLRGSFNFDAK